MDGEPSGTARMNWWQEQTPEISMASHSQGASHCRVGRDCLGAYTVKPVAKGCGLALFFFFFLLFLGLLPQHMEVHRLGVKSEL